MYKAQMDKFTDADGASIVDKMRHKMQQLTERVVSLTKENRALTSIQLHQEKQLLSDDLLPLVLAPIDVTQRHAMEVCKAWRTAWLASDISRRGLRPAKALPAVAPPLGRPEDLHDIVALDGDRLFVAHNEYTCVLNKQMQMQEQMHHISCVSVAVGHDRFYRSFGAAGCVHAVKLTDYSLLAGECVVDNEDGEVWDLALAPGGPLFAISPFDMIGKDCHSKILVLDPATLETRAAFGHFPAYELQCLVVAGDELLVGHIGDHRLHVFSFIGEPLREISGAWRKPHKLRFVNDRLYLLEVCEAANVFDSEAIVAKKAMAALRVFVLTPQGETLQVYDCRPHLQHGDWLVGMTFFDGRLLLASHDGALLSLRV